MPKEISKEKIEAVLSKYKPLKHNILKALHALQDAHPFNYLSIDILEAVSQHFALTKGQVFGIVSYYSMFSLKPRGKNLIRLCKSPVCRMMGTEDIENILKEMLKLDQNNISPNGQFSLETVECLGGCDKAPSLMINQKLFHASNKKTISDILMLYKNK